MLNHNVCFKESTGQINIETSESERLEDANIPYYRTSMYQKLQRAKRKQTDSSTPYSSTAEYKKAQRVKCKETNNIPYSSTAEYKRIQRAKHKKFVSVSQEWDWDNPCRL